MRVYGIVCEPFHYRVIIEIVRCSTANVLRLSTAHALPMFQEDKPRSLKRTREKERADPVLSRKPDAPIGKHGETRDDVYCTVAQGSKHACTQLHAYIHNMGPTYCMYQLCGVATLCCCLPHTRIEWICKDCVCMSYISPVTPW